MSPPTAGDGRLPRELPLVGRSAELERLFTVFGEGGESSRLRLLSGESGVGKSRLALTLAAEAERRGWRVLRGRAYPVEQGVPYAVLADAMVPMLQDVDASKLTVLSRGRESDLHRLFPALGMDVPREEGLEPEELRTRLFWTFTSVLKRFSEQRPILVVLEDLHWADPSSISLLHFVVRQLDEHQLRVVATYTAEDRDRNAELVRMERSLESLGRVDHMELPPLDLGAVEELLSAVFHMAGPPVSDFARRLYGWTRGNPFFVEQILQSLVQQGALHRRDGTWLGWESQELTLPSTVRDAVLTRLHGLSPLAREASEVIAVAGRPSPAGLVERVLARDRSEVADAVAELVIRGIVEERLRDGRIMLQFRHPLARETLYRGLSLTRRRLLHQNIATALEALYSAAPEVHADEIAYHLTQAGGQDTDPRASRYLTLAGRQALERHAGQEAADYLSAALAALGQPEDDGDRATAFGIRRDLARALTRNGRYEDAVDEWLPMLEEARARGDAQLEARALRHLGLLSFWRGRHTEALEHLRAARAVIPDGHPELVAHVELAAGMAFQQLGRARESRERILAALESATELGDRSLLARVHRALALVNTWIGETAEARVHGQKAVELGEAAGDAEVLFWGRWALASLEGLVGGPEPIKPWLLAARESATELGSPILGLWVDELELELRYFGGEWDAALALGTRAIQRARVLNQRGILVRMLVWTSSVYIGRGDLDRAEELVDEACTLAGVRGGSTPETRDVHVSVPALIGRTALHMARQDYEDAVRVGKAGLAVAEASGYVIWVIHRLLPMVGEAYLHLRELDSAEEVMHRLRREGRRMDHRLSLVWATAAESILTWLRQDDPVRACELLEEAADAMDEIGICYDAARLRRQLAGRLNDLGRTDEGLGHLRRVFQTFQDLGARPESERAREMFPQMGARSPGGGAARREPGGRLSQRQFEIAELVAQRMSNQAIADTLGIKLRTVQKHLTNSYQILDLDASMNAKRAILGDMVREGRLLPPEDS